ncbi:MAG: helix-turn-helix domain-containing protein [Rhodospirillales bacterium]|nr:helix-turn-helix domain-containing protein [Rhodospirillales bacterium]
MTDHDDRFLTSTEAAEVLGLSGRTLARYRHTGRGPAYYKFGNLARYRLQDIKAWASTRRVRKPRKKRRT